MRGHKHSEPGVASLSVQRFCWSQAPSRNAEPCGPPWVAQLTCLLPPHSVWRWLQSAAKWPCSQDYSAVRPLRGGGAGAGVALLQAEAHCAVELRQGLSRNDDGNAILASHLRRQG